MPVRNTEIEEGDKYNNEKRPMTLPAFFFCSAVAAQAAAVVAHYSYRSNAFSFESALSRMQNGAQ
jgi:hypothetical protein